jgi:hypothetical protein
MEKKSYRFVFACKRQKCRAFRLKPTTDDQHLFPSTKLTWRHFGKMEEVLNDYVTNPNPTPTLTLTKLIKKYKKKQL